MTQDAIVQRLRAASAEDVSAAIAGSYVEELAAIDESKLLEFFQRMLDKLVEPRGD